MLNMLKGIFKSALSESEVAEFKKQLLRICAGALVQGKSLAEIQRFLVQYVAASDFPVSGSAALINSVIEDFAQLMQSAGVQPENLRSEPQSSGAVERVINGSTYVEPTPETHVFKTGAPLWKKKRR